MTYRGYHARYTLPPLLLLILLAILLDRHAIGFPIAGVLALVAVVFTFPWDNAAVKRGMWEFPADRVWFRVSHLPIEEVAFFVIQTVMVSIATSLIGIAWSTIVPTSTISPLSQFSMYAAGVTVGIGWILACKHNVRTYGGHLLLWFLPIVVAQWIFGWGILAPRFVPILAATVGCSVYLVWTDVQAVRNGVWHFGASNVGAVRLFGVLPWEEVAFFVLTSLLVAQSTVLLLPEALR